MPAQRSGATRSALNDSERIRVLLIDHHIFGVAAVDVPAGEPRFEAQVLTVSHTEPAGPTGLSEPRHADPLSHAEPLRARAESFHQTDCLMSGDHPGVLRPKVSLREVEIGSAHAAGLHTEPNLARTRFGNRPFDESERMVVDRTGPIDDPRAHHLGVRAALGPTTRRCKRTAIGHGEDTIR